MELWQMAKLLLKQIVKAHMPLVSYDLCQCASELLLSGRRPSVCLSIKPIFSEPIMQVNAKFGERYLSNTPPDNFSFFEILHFRFFTIFVSLSLIWNHM